jgi:GTP-binding protein HflX
LLSDTVGFIRDLPHHLIASFRATLEEARQADLLMHVADASNPSVFQQISSVYKVLKELDIQEKDTLLVLNKCDCPGADERISLVHERYPNAIPISALSGLGLQRLSMAVSDSLTSSFVELELRLPIGDGKTIAWLATHAEVLSKHYQDDLCVVHCRMSIGCAGKLAGNGVDMRVLQGTLPEPIRQGLPNNATFVPAESQTSLLEVSVPEVSIEDLNVRPKVG